MEITRWYTEGKWYLSGKMSGLPQSNVPMFNRVATSLRAQGFDVVSPAELDAVEDRKSKKTWGDFLSRDVKVLADGGITGIIFLPGWEDSDGARLEATLGLLKKFSFMRWDDNIDTPVMYSTRTVADILHQEFTR
jgi:hypothetical protein